MAGSDVRVVVNMACGECKSRNYTTKKNKRNDPNRMEMNKHCRVCKKHTVHREAK
jgi:large subunit ribosomal protein L33